MDGPRPPFEGRALSESPIVHVTSVVDQGAGFYEWTFGDNVDSTDSLCAGYQVGTSPVFTNPAAAAITAANKVVMQYAAGAGLPDWKILGTPTGIVFANGGTLAPGQTGSVT